MFEFVEVCSGHVVELEVFKKRDPLVSKHNFKFRGHPISIDTPKSEAMYLGLSVHHSVMEKMLLEDDTFEFWVSFSFV